MSKKVVVTGMGVITPLGNDLETFWEAICEGRSGIGPITHFDTTGFRSTIGGQVEPCAPPDMTPKDINRFDDYSIFAIAASERAIEHSGLDLDKENLDRCGVILGTGIGGIGTIANEVVKLHEGGARRISPFMIPKGLANMASGNVAIRVGFRGPNKSIVTACASSTHCIGEAARLIEAGRADVMLAGGSEAPLVPFGVGGFCSMRALSTRNDDPEHACRPFDKDRDGFVMSEGAGMVILEAEDRAKARGADIYCEYAGMGESCDAFHMVSPAPDGSGGAAALKNALDDAQLNPEDIQYFNAHGTSTVHNEPAEAKALHITFGKDMPPVSSTKSMMGHLLGAAGSVEGIVCALAMRNGIFPPSINFDTPDPECEVNLVANEAREGNIEISMSNTLGFGGHNAVLILRRYG